jgi:hypothetical protein
MRAWSLTLTLVSVSSVASAQGSAQHSTTETTSPRVEPIADESPRVRVRVAEDTLFRVGGYLETFYSWNFNQPSNRITERVEVVPWLFAAGRTTLFWEHRASNGNGTAAPIAIPAGRMASQTLTLEAIPMRGLSFKLKGRYDSADALTFLSGRVSGDGSPTSPFIANSRDQFTLTLGATA